ncbi:SDR family oxidoreductase [Priestia megaterium]
MGYKNVTFPKEASFLVTGAAGFIGSNLVEALISKGYKVRGLDNFSTGKKEYVEEFIHNDNYEFIEGDIRNFNTCVDACNGIDYVLHQAAMGSVPHSMEEPLVYEDNNIRGTANMMEAARQAGVRRFVYASSSAVYGDSPTLPKVEGDEGDILSPYALTKMVKEQYGEIYTQVYGLECIGLRYFNVFGKRQDPDSQYAAVIPTFIKLLQNDEAPTINGDGEQSRDFAYIENVIEANLKACVASEKAVGQAFNIAFGGRETLTDLYLKICKHLEKDIQPIFGPERPGDIKHSSANISKAKSLLDYDPDYDFEKGLTLAIEWYKEHL